MEVDNSADVEDSNHSSKAKEISLEHVNVNGINGYSSEKHKSHKSEHKDKHKDKDRDKERDRDKNKDHKSSHKDKDRHSSSSKDKDRHSSHKSSSKDKDRSDRDRDKDRSDRDKDRGDRDKDRSDREKDRSDRDKDRSDRDKDRSDRDKDRSDREKDRSDRDKDRGDRDKSRSDRDKDRDKHRDKDRHRDDKKSSSKDKDRDHKSSRDKEHKSSSSKDKEGRDKDREKDRDKDKEREKDKEKRDKDKDREKDRHKHSSSKDKDKDRHSSSKDKHRDKERDREKEKHSSSKDKDRKDKEKKLEKEKEEEKKLKEEIDVDSAKEDSVDEDEQKLVIKEDPDSQDEIDFPDVSQASSCDYNLSHFSNQPKLEDEFYKEEEDSQQGDDDSQQEDDDSQQEEDDSQQEDDSRLEGNSHVKEESDEEYKPNVKAEQPADDSDEDMPLAARLDKSGGSMKRKLESEDEDDLPLMARKKVKKEKKEKKKKKYESDYEDEEEDYKPLKKKGKKEREKEKKVKVKKESTEEVSLEKGRKKKKEEEEQEVWKWWEEQKRDDGTKWTFLEHKGPVFAPPYERLPSHVKFLYDGKEMELSEGAEEVAGFYAKMLDHDYTSKEAFNKNFFDDWRKMMTEKERKIITDLKKCNFKKMHAYFMDLSEKNKNRTKEEKKALKEKNEALMKEYGFCTIDGHKEKIGNFKIEPPGLFRGRGEHPKMGKLKRRVVAEDIIINCSKDSKIPEPPPGHKWKEVRHDPSVTWLASWTENVQNQVKYIMLNPSSKLKGEKDWQKYETARRLQKCIDKIRREYKEDWKSKEMRIRQRAVALYFIDRLALRAGNEKDEDQADTVGCCSLRVEHIELHEKKDDKDYVVVFDFLGKDSIRYYNEVPVEKRVFKNLQLFMENKRPGDDLFDRLTTQILNKHLNELMEGLTAKVFRTYNASWTLQQQLDELTNPDDSIAEKILSYNRANRAVAILCNHQRSVPKGHQKSMEKLKEKIEQKREQIRDAERQVKDAAKDAKRGSVKEKQIYEKKSKMLQKMKEQLTKLEIQETDRDENKTIALGTSKLNYLDPRISVAWCKKYGVPIEKIYNKTQRDKFRWAIDMAGPDYHF